MRKLEIPIQNVSSTVIRKKRKNGEPVRNLEAVGISDFINKRSIYLDNLTYTAVTFAKERYAIENEGKQIGEYIEGLMDYLDKLLVSEKLQKQEVKKYQDFKERCGIL